MKALVKENGILVEVCTYPEETGHYYEIVNGRCMSDYDESDLIFDYKPEDVKYDRSEE